MSRAAPLRPEQRRAAIMAVTERLIVAQGGVVSTRAIAEAAGIAEGTIFRVFPTKETIIDAIFEDAFDRDAIREELAASQPEGGLDGRMAQVVTILQRRNRRILALFNALGARKPPGMGDPQYKERWELSLAEIAALIEPDAHQLRMAPLEVARLLQTLVIALSSPLVSQPTDYAPEAIVDLVLNGVLRTESDQAGLGSMSC